MRRSLVSLAALNFLTLGTFAPSFGDEPPPLTAPSANPEPVVTVPPPRVVQSQPAEDRRPMLVVPGLTTPRANLARPKPLTVTVPGNSPRIESNDLGLGRGDRPGSPPLPEPSRPAESGPMTEMPAFDVPSPRPESEARPGRSSLPSEPRPKASADSRRPQGLFGRLFQPNAAKTARARAAAEPREESEADALLKRKAVKEIRDKIGSRVSSFEVQVSGQAVSIRARVPRFWQRRAVRTDLQSLSSLRGYKTDVELVD